MTVFDMLPWGLRDGFHFQIKEFTCQTESVEDLPETMYFYPNFPLYNACP